jgi:hypothetical protein
MRPPSLSSVTGSMPLGQPIRPMSGRWVEAQRSHYRTFAHWVRFVVFRFEKPRRTTLTKKCRAIGTIGTIGTGDLRDSATQGSGEDGLQPAAAVVRVSGNATCEPSGDCCAVAAPAAALLRPLGSFSQNGESLLHEVNRRRTYRSHWNRKERGMTAPPCSADRGSPLRPAWFALRFFGCQQPLALWHSGHTIRQGADTAGIGHIPFRACPGVRARGTWRTIYPRATGGEAHCPQ